MDMYIDIIVDKNKNLYCSNSPFQQQASIPDHREIWTIELVS